MSRIGGDARRQVQAAVPRAEMRMHVEQARQQHLAAGIDDVVGLGKLAAAVGDGNDPAIADQQVRSRAQRRVLAVEHARVADQGGTGQRMGQALLHAQQHFALGLLLLLFQRGGVGFPAFLDELQEAGVDEGEQARIVAGRGPGEGSA